MPETDFALKEGDTSPALEVQLLDNSDPVDLYDAAVIFRMNHISEDQFISGLCTIEDKEAGRVAYIWSEGETDVTGTYEGEFAVDYSTPEDTDEFEANETFPPDGYLRIEIHPRVEE